MQTIILNLNLPLENYDVSTFHDKEIIAIIPSEDVLLTSVNLPKLSKSRMLQALPFALEEQLIADVESLHFATIQKPTGDWAVAVIAKEKMQRYTNLCKQLKIKPDYIIPDILAIPGDATHWHVFLKDNKAIVRTDFFQGFSCERENLQEYIQLSLACLTELPEKITIHNYTEVSVAGAFTIAIANDEIMLPSEQFQKDITKHTNLNLLQGTFTNTKSKNAPIKKLQRLAFALCVLFVISLLIYPTVSYFILKNRLNLINTEIASIFKHNFPDAKSTIAPKMRMEEKLHRITGKGAQTGFLNILANVAIVVNQNANISIKHYEYQNNQLNLQLSALTSDDITNFSNELNSKGYKVKQQNVDITDAGVNAILIVSS